MKTNETKIAELKSEYAEITAELNSDKEISEHRHHVLRSRRYDIRKEIASLEAENNNDDNTTNTVEEKAEAEAVTVEVETPATVEVEIGGKVQEFHYIDADTITNKNGSCTLKIQNTECHNLAYAYEMYSQTFKLSDEVIINMEIMTYGHDSANLLCKFIATTTDGSEDDADDNDDVFNALPSVDELNDVDGEFDEYAAEDTDRDARFNHGERHAAALTKKLAEFDPTVEVIYDIDDEGEDVFYLRYDGIYRTPFGTLDGVEVSFHVMKEDGVGNHDDEPQGDFVITDPTILPPNEESFITRDYCDKINVNAPDGWEIRYVGERKISGSKFTNAVLYIFHNNRFVTEFKGLLSSKFVKNPAAFFATFDAPEPVDDDELNDVEIEEPDEDAEAEKFMRDTEKQFRTMTSEAYPFHKKLFNNEFDFPADHEGKTYSIEIYNQNNKLVATPNIYKLVDYRFDVYVDRYDLDYQIIFGPTYAGRDTIACTKLARYTKIKNVERVVKMFAHAVTARRSWFWFPDEEFFNKRDEENANEKFIATQMIFINGWETDPVRKLTCEFNTIEEACEFIADENPFIEETCSLAYHDGRFFGGIYFAGWEITDAAGNVLAAEDLCGAFTGDDKIYNLVVTYACEKEDAKAANDNPPTTEPAVDKITNEKEPTIMTNETKTQLANVTEPELTFAQKQAAAVIDYIGGATPEFVFAEVTNSKTPRLTIHYEFDGELEDGTGTRVIEFFTDEHNYILDHVTVLTNESDGNLKSKKFNFNPPVNEKENPKMINTNVKFNIARFGKPDDNIVKLAEDVAASMTQKAPHGWAVAYNIDDNNFDVTVGGTSVASVDTITFGDFNNPDEFYSQFITPDEADAETRKLQALRRELVANFPDQTERIKILDEMIHEVRREKNRRILDDEFERNPLF